MLGREGWRVVVVAVVVVRNVTVCWNGRINIPLEVNM